MKSSVRFTLSKVYPTLALIALASAGEAFAQEPAVSQPLPFSHRVHAGGAPSKMACATCHRESGVGGRGMSLPPPSACMGCHRTVARGKPAIEALAAAARQRRRIPWEPVWFLPEFVRFSHHAHRASDCAVCHGPVAQRDALWREVETNMKFCRACHKQNGARIECGTCHAER